MAINAECPACKKNYLRIRPELLGKKAQCTCGQTFVLGTMGSVAPESPDADDSIDLSSVDVFENSYSDLEQILAGQGSPAPLASKAMPKNAPPSVSGRSRTSTKPADPAVVRCGSKAKSIGFMAALCSATLAFWACVLIVQSRFEIIDQPLVGPISHAISEASQGVLADLSISNSLQQTFVVLGWAVTVVAVCLLPMAIVQLASAFARTFRGKPLIPNLDGLTAIVAVLLLFLIIGFLFLHSSHMSQVTRELNQLALGAAAGQVAGQDGQTLIAQNIQRLQLKHDQQSRQFVSSIFTLAAAPLMVFILSAIRVYVTIGESIDESTG